MSEKVVIRPMTQADIPGVVALQRACFPAPFSEEYLWQPKHLEMHLARFAEGQFVASIGTRIVGSASNAIVTESVWQAHLPWEETLGGFSFESHDPNGTTLYGADISVHPDCRKQGIGKMLYSQRFELVAQLHLARYGTACRIPDYQATAQTHSIDPHQYVNAVAQGIYQDRTLTPLLKMGLNLVDCIENYMDDEESGNCAAVLEWRPQ
ncbi:MAG: GNAT family N-acetyltransferase [Armatimonadetes bacterium]|nr:GNAT family N-acetyltransferase [Armatimonadota bacterium]